MATTKHPKPVVSRLVEFESTFHHLELEYRQIVAELAKLGPEASALRLDVVDVVIQLQDLKHRANSQRMRAETFGELCAPAAGSDPACLKDGCRHPRSIHRELRACSIAKCGCTFFCGPGDLSTAEDRACGAPAEGIQVVCDLATGHPGPHAAWKPGNEPSSVSHARHLWHTPKEERSQERMIPVERITGYRACAFPGCESQIPAPWVYCRVHPVEAIEALPPREGRS